VILRPSVVGKSLDPYVGYDDNVFLKVGTYHGPAVTGTSIIGIFNISQRPLTELLHLSKFSGVIEAQYYIIRSHVSGIVTEPLQVVDPAALITISLDIRGYDILSSYPLRGFVLKSDETVWIANLGLLGKMTGAAAIVNSNLTMEDTGRIELSTSLKALGTLGIYISDLQTRSIESGFLVTILGKVIPRHTVLISAANPKVLEIDVERAWTEMELDSGWGNEVTVRVFLT